MFWPICWLLVWYNCIASGGDTMWLFTFIFSLSVFAQTEVTSTTLASDDETISVSGVVVAVRTSPITEVFLRGAKQSVVIPPGSGHNELLAKVVEKQRTGGSMSFTINAKTHRVIPTKPPASSSSSGPSTEEGSSK